MFFRKKKVILSFDYELFFGDKSGTVRRSIVEPTNQLLNAMEDVGLVGNFFVDWLMLKYLKDQKTKQTDEDYFLIVEQLKDIVSRGHRIELHIHPHWVDAKYNGDGTWDFSEFRHYELNSFKEEEINNFFVEGTELLTSIAREVDPNYKIVAFRAGGWRIRPFDKLHNSFIQCNILIDSSIMDSQVSCNTNSERTCAYYKFSKDPLVADIKGKYLEMPIASYRRDIFHKITYQIAKKKNDFLQKTDGTHIRSSYQNGSKCQSNNSNVMMMNLSKLPALSVLCQVLSYKYSILCIIDHPKDITNSTIKGIHLLGRFCEPLSYYNILS